jgi:general L-amino acid transport system substrate-binding protein
MMVREGRSPRWPAPPHFFGLVLAALAQVFALAALAACAPQAEGPTSPTLARLRERVRLICAIDGKVPGFSSLDRRGNYHGI